MPVLPRLIAHADWSSNAKKRWICLAELDHQGSYRVRVPKTVGNPQSLFTELLKQADGGNVFAGFDFPIGLPSAYAEKIQIRDFRSLLPELGHGVWADFFEVARERDEIGPLRPFYPMTPGKKAGVRKQNHLLKALQTKSIEDLLRECEKSTDTRAAASSLFWTLGAKQVGKAAIVGWRDVLIPALQNSKVDVAIWPFDGSLFDLLSNHKITVAETYPAEACLHLCMSPPGSGWSKTNQADRASQGEHIRNWLCSRKVHAESQLLKMIGAGFGPSKDSEDPFDAFVGLLSMLEVVLGHRAPGDPCIKQVRSIEGWILGQSWTG